MTDGPSPDWAELRRLAEAATRYGVSVFAVLPRGDDDFIAAFIAAANPATILALLDRAERAEKALAVALRTLRKVDELTTFVQACDAALDAIETEADRENREMIDELEAEAARLREALDACHFYIDASDTELTERHMSRADALFAARRARALTGGDHG